MLVYYITMKFEKKIRSSATGGIGGKLFIYA